MEIVFGSLYSKRVATQPGRLALREGVKNPSPESHGLVSTAEVGMLLEFRASCP